MALHLERSYGVAQQMAELTDPSITTLLVEEGGQAVAYAQVRTGHVPECVPGAAPIELWRFYVQRGWHGRGIAQALMARVVAEAGGRRREDAVAGRVGTQPPGSRVLRQMWFHRRRRARILVRDRSADRSRHGQTFMKTRRLIGMSIVATGFIWFQVAGRFEARRIDEQRESRVATQATAASLRVDSDRLMEVVSTLADPKFEGRAAGSPGGIAARAWVLERFKSIGLQPVSGSYVFPFTFTRMTMNGPRRRCGRERGRAVPGHRHQGASLRGFIPLRPPRRARGPDLSRR